MKYSRRNGFTLIEVLIAITLLGVMVVLLFGSLRIAAQSWDAGEDKITEVNKKAVVYQFFKRHLTTIRPLPMLEQEESNIEEGSLQAFQGYPQRLRFVASLPASSARKGLQLFNIAPDPADPSTLTVKLKPYRQTEEKTDPIDPPVVLLKDVEQIMIAYFGKTEDTAETQWRDEWTLADRLPQLIRVTIRLKDGSYWPDMVFPLKITVAHNAESVAEDAVVDDMTNVETP